MTHQKVLKTGIIASILLVAAILTTTTTTATNVQAKNIINDLGNALNQGGDGFSAGQDNGRSDYRNNNAYNDKCDPNGNDAWCVGYIGGYAAGWNGLAGSGESRGNDDNNGNNDDGNSNNGNREDDGEFVPRTIGDSNKRTIGDNN